MTRILIALLLSACVWGRAHAGEIRIVTSEPNAVVVEVSVSDLVRHSVLVNGQTLDRIDVGGWVHWYEPGAPSVPARGTALGIPFGARAIVQVIDADYEELQGIDLLPVADTQWMGSEAYPVSREVYRKNPVIYGRDAFYPDEQAEITREGTMRDQRIALLSLRPIQYNPVRRILRVARRLRVRVQFVQGPNPTAYRSAGGSIAEGLDTFYEHSVLNASQARPWRRR
ncbi:MAG: hypothetical protein O3B73_07880, partial [bacterium]|nr:hypothetical protein [bacterium]